MKSIPLDKVTKRLLTIRGLRSIGQGAMVVDLTLYLAKLHWSGTAIGGVISAAGLFGAGLILLVGVLSDKIGRRPFLLIYESLTILAALSACLTSNAIILTLAIVIAGFGRGQSGAAGPFSPAEQAWLARHVKQENRGQVFSLNNAIGFGGMALGALIGGLPKFLQGILPGALAYRPIFVFIAVVSVACVVILLCTKEEPRMAKPVMPTSEHLQQERDSRRKENGEMLKMAGINVLNGIAVGLTGPMMAYWLSVRYDASTAAIGLTVSLSFVMTSFSSLLNGYLAGRVGMVKATTWMRVIGSSLMILLPFMPTFSIASVLYILRNAINRGTQGNRSALSASITRDGRRGLATSLNAFSMRLPSSIGPTISGYLFDIGDLYLPLFLTAGFQLANAALYQWGFGKYDKAKRTQ